MQTPRVLILGVPRAGKSTLAKRLARGTGLTPRSTDSLIALGWHHASERAREWLDEDGPYLIEGVAAVRALRKWLRAPYRPDTAPTRIIWLGTPRLPLSERQAQLAAGTATIWREILPLLHRLRVPIENA